MTSLIVGDKFVILFRKDFLPRMNMITQMVDTDTHHYSISSIV